MDLIAGPVQETGVDEDDSLTGRADTGGQVQGRSPLLVHDPDLHGVFWQVQHALGRGEDRHRVGHFGTSVQLGLDDVDAPRPAVAVDALPSNIEGTNRHRHRGIEHPLRDRLACLGKDRVAVHVKTDVANQQQAPSWELERRPVG